MSTAAQSPAVTELSILKAIAIHYWENCDYPESEELIKAIGPYCGLSSLIGSLKAKGWLQTHVVGSRTHVELRLPDRRRNWIDNYEEITALGHFLANEQVYTGEQLQAYYEKPWHFHDEYAAYLAASERLESV